MKPHAFVRTATIIASTLALFHSVRAAPLEFVEDRMELPPGFRMYRAAGPELCEGSYDITFDGEGRLLVGDGSAVRRLADEDGDGLFDHYDVIARGLGPRGPQGLLVYGDRLYAVGGDGVQVYGGYTTSAGELGDSERIGEPFSTGGDHAAHTIFRGLDDWLYFVTGDGGGARGRVHITEETSPAREERAASVFRIRPDGGAWECVATGGRNPPNLGMNELGELFSLDSDMEWHVGLPWWRPVRLHHWIPGGDQGWQGVGAYPPYFIDNVPGIVDVGRGSPDWGVFYEHDAFPSRYRGAYFVADYRWKSATTGGYDTNGRLLVFFVERLGAGFTAKYEVFARPKRGARHRDGRPIDFALVDVEVGPDGSLWLSDHHQGVWRIVYDPDGTRTRDGAPPVGVPFTADDEPEDRVAELLALPQPGSEWSRLRRVKLERSIGAELETRLLAVAGDPAAPLGRRLRAVRYLAARFDSLALEAIASLARSDAPEIRGQAAWLAGIRAKDDAVELLLGLARDTDPFVRRRAVEALVRVPPPADRLGELVRRLADSDRLVRYAAMISLSHRPAADWFERALSLDLLEARLRAIVAADLRDESPPAAEIARVLLPALEESAELSRSEHLDVARIAGRFRGELVAADAGVRSTITRWIIAGLDAADSDIRYEHIRLAGEYELGEAFGKLLSMLEAKSDPVRAFHLAQALARLPDGWSTDEETRALAWFVASDAGSFGDGAGKGHQYLQFWQTVLADFALQHRALLLDRLGELDLAGRFGSAALDVVADAPGACERLRALFESSKDSEVRERVAAVLGRVREPAADSVLRALYRKAIDPGVQRAILVALADRPPNEDNRAFIEQGVLAEDVELFRKAALALARLRPRISEDVALFALTRMFEHREALRPGEILLTAMSHADRPDARNSGERELGRAPSGKERDDLLARWTAWFRDTFGREFRPVGTAAAVERSNEELARFLASDDVGGGIVLAGRRIYDELCSRCHGHSTPAPDDVLLGPDLRGATRRLSRDELVDALVFPSKTVAERFQGVAVQLRGGGLIEGFVTESTDENLVVVEGDRVHRLPRRRILFTTPLETSLMPEGLLNRLSDEDLRHLFAFLDSFGTEAGAVGDAKEEHEAEKEDSQAPEEKRER